VTRATAWLVVRLGFLLVPAWIVAAFAAVHWLPGIAQQADSPLGGLVPRGAAAIDTQQREVQIFGNTLLTRVVVVQHADAPLTQAQLGRTAGLADTIDHHHSQLLRHIAFAAPVPSPDRRTVVSYLYFRNGVSIGAQLALAQTYAHSVDPPGLRTGTLLARETEFDRIQSALPRLTLATIALIAVILLITFRAPGPPLLVLGASGIAYVVATHLLAWVGEQRGQQVPKEVEPILVALLLGLVTDYAVFFLAGMRRQLAAGTSRFAAADETTRENLPIILTAGLVVALGSLSLVAGHLGVFRAFGPGMALTVLVTLAVALTFLPGLLALLGPLVFWPSLARAEREPRARLWRKVTARPVSALLTIVVFAGLVLCCFGLLQARLGFTLVRGQPQGAEVKVAQENAAKGFAEGVVAPTEVLVPNGDLPRLRAEIAGVPGVAQVLGGSRLPAFVSDDRKHARLLVVLRDDPLGAQAIATFRRLQEALPSGAQYAGDTALAAETVDAIRSDAVRVGIVVLLVNFLLLAIFLRRLGAPLYLLAASVLAVGATLGILTWVMHDLLHHEDLTYYVPFAAAVLLLSLGSDYNLFVVGRIWQAAREQPLRDAIAEVAPRTSSAITTAGVTLAGSFALLAVIPLRPMRELAFAMSLGILLDTFIVRSVLVPSLLALFRRKERTTERSADGEAPVHE
jgi:RND superfamily putative drug exporter